MEFPKILSFKFSKISQKRKLPSSNHHGKKSIDFFSNDYLGIAQCKKNLEKADHVFNQNFPSSGSTGSRLISGNHPLYRQLEKRLSDFYQTESALVFNSGYQANIGLLSAILQRQDVVVYDVLSHASIKDGVRLGFAKSFSFLHNDTGDLVKKILYAKELISKAQGNIYIIIESLYSMDGDIAHLEKICQICAQHSCYLIVDEAHATGIFEEGKGLSYPYKNQLFAQVHAFGKAIGAYGAAVCGSKKLKEFLVNFSRTFIYTTALPPHSLAQLYSIYGEIMDGTFATARKLLWKNITHFKQNIKSQKLAQWVSQNDSPIQTVILGNQKCCLNLQDQLSALGFLVKAVFAPTVPKGSERIRICLHSYNSPEEITLLLLEIKKWVS